MDKAVMRYPNIEAERSRANLTREDFAAMLGVTRKTVYNWTIKGCIPLDMLIKMAKGFGCSIDYLLGLTETRTPVNQLTGQIGGGAGGPVGW